MSLPEFDLSGMIALVTGEFDVSRWRRAGFDVDFVPVCTTGAHLLP